jgi:hypothetical protein
MINPYWLSKKYKVTNKDELRDSIDEITFPDNAEGVIVTFGTQLERGSVYLHVTPIDPYTPSIKIVYNTRIYITNPRIANFQRAGIFLGYDKFRLEDRRGVYYNGVFQDVSRNKTAVKRISLIPEAFFIKLGEIRNKRFIPDIDYYETPVLAIAQRPSDIPIAYLTHSKTKSRSPSGGRKTKKQLKI